MINDPTGGCGKRTSAARWVLCDGPAAKCNREEDQPVRQKAGERNGSSSLVVW